MRKVVGNQSGPRQLELLARAAAPHLKSEIVEGLEATYGQKKTEVASDKINLQWVLGNKLLLGSVNANREYFESGIKDFALGENAVPWRCSKLTDSSSGRTS